MRRWVVLGLEFKSAKQTISGRRDCCRCVRVLRVLRVMADGILVFLQMRLC